MGSVTLPDAGPAIAPPPAPEPAAGLLREPAPAVFPERVSGPAAEPPLAVPPADPVLELLVGPGTDRTVVTLVGDLTMSTACILGRVLSDLVDQGHRFLVLDARALGSCDGAGWTLLLGIRWRLATVSGRLRITGLAPRLMSSCVRLELAEVFELDEA
ncbi:STAS domain-containing protein [Planomonospora venezuelensis]|uniref:Anti-anti-sigma regulatory factor n=1 Tax=Planomonospora venezuelensis TaxID=1999 RepID=A0A841DHK2_PLAVE|nr:STAS domain-containing protein [Planomonospora venezuelensis]MBB5967575.1 anti-anti-sigma regulatory factor [Planomonospora venezuelensis]GIN00228.1 hypothetical protein Pve01_18860 [Planomonospora venezuelensis]